jgi:hypothetical protein
MQEKHENTGDVAYVTGVLGDVADVTGVFGDVAELPALLRSPQ